jgi:hypothetical protein
MTYRVLTKLTRKYFGFSYCSETILLVSNGFKFSFFFYLNRRVNAKWSLSWFPWQRVAANKDAIKSKVPNRQVEVIIALRKFDGRHQWYGKRLRNIGVINDQICSVCRNHNPVLSSFMTFHRICNQRNTTDATYGSGTAYLFRWYLSSSLVFSAILVARSLVFCMFCRLLYVLLSFFFWPLDCLSFTASDDPFWYLQTFRNSYLIYGLVVVGNMFYIKIITDIWTMP